MVNTNTVQQVMWNVAHEHFRPVVIVVAGTRSDTENPVVAVIAVHVGGKLSVDVGVMFSGHISATSPGFVSNTPVLHRPGFLTAIFYSKLRHRALSIERGVLDPVGKLLYRATSNISRDVWLGTE